MIRNTDEVQTISDLKVAIMLHRPVVIDYESASGERSVRTVEPFEMNDLAKRPFFRAMDRRSGDYRSFRLDRLSAYRVASRRGRNRVPRPEPRLSTVISQENPPDVSPEELSTAWGDWLKSLYNPDAPIPYLPTLYALNEEK